MADLAFIQLLLEAVARTAGDEESRRRTTMLILSPVLFVIILIAFVVYLLTSPFSLLAECLMGEEVGAVEAFQKEYGYNQSIGIYDSDYTEGSGKSYEGIVFGEAGQRQVAYYSQLDERWAGQPYGTDKIGTHGCGPTCMAMVVSTLTGKTVEPPEMAQWAYENGYWCPENGSYHSLIPEAAGVWGLSVQSGLSAQDIVDALAEGRLVVAIMAEGHFTSGGHFIVLRGVTAEGKILVADPASLGRSSQEWDLPLIINEARKGAGAGGPFWAIG